MRGGPSPLTLRNGVVLPLLIMLGALFGVLFGGSLLFATGMEQYRVVSWIYFLYAMALIGGAEWHRRRIGLDMPHIGLVQPDGFRPYLTAVLAGIALYLGMEAFELLFPLPELIDARQVVDAMLRDGEPSFLGLFTAVLLIGFLTPVGEEYVFRGFILHSLAARMAPHRANLVTSALFAACHISVWMLPLAAGVYTMAQIFLLSCVLGWVTLRFRSLGPAILVHCLNNSLGVLLAYT